MTRRPTRETQRCLCATKRWPRSTSSPQELPFLRVRSWGLRRHLYDPLLTREGFGRRQRNPRCMSTVDESERLSFEAGRETALSESEIAQSMLNVSKFDLWKRDDVAEHSDAILGRLEDGSMPCDQAWPDERVALFRRWMDAGKPE